MAAAEPTAAGVPTECLAAAASASANVWERAKVPALRPYCDLLASGAAKLAASPASGAPVAEIARRAEASLPGQAGPMVLLARAYAIDSRWSECSDALVEARRRSARALDDASALLAWARAQRNLGHVDESLRAYRALLPRTSALTPAEETAAQLEAGLLLMAMGPSAVVEAATVLRLAVRSSHAARVELAAVALALALDRADRGEEARVILAGRARDARWDDGAEGELSRELSALGARSEVSALRAIALARFDGRKASALWRLRLERSVEGDRWREHARARLGAARELRP